MARSKEEEGGEEEGEIWGTWEELLLACAVNRHGAHCWDSVAMELRSRTTPAYAHLLTPDLCRSRYRHLRLRFTGGDGTDDCDQEDPTAKIPWLDELRKLRVAELRQALDRSDVSIGSLQLKVKRLKEERERSLKEPESAGDGGSGSDPVVPGGGSDGSCKESNSTEKKAEEEAEDPDPKAVTGSGSDRGGGAGEASYNGSTGGEGVRLPAEETNPVNESGESVAETKESSDVQSSASLSRRRRRRVRRRMEADAVSSPVREPVESESQPLISFLDMIRSTKHGPVFERRLESQENERYRSIIRRHVDLETIQGRIGRSAYTSAAFFRDLLLLCTNAIVYFPKSSRESIAAVHIRDLVTGEISSTLGELPSPPSAMERKLLPAQHSLPVPPNSEPKPNTPPPDKKPVAPLTLLVACRKRSSVTAKPSVKRNEKPKQEFVVNEKDKVDKKKKKAMPEFIIDENEKEEEEKEKKKREREKEEEEEEEKEKKKREKEEEEEEEEIVDKKSTKQQRSALARGLRTNKTRSGSKVAAKSQTIGTRILKEETESKAEQETKPPAASAAKKRSAANFLNRMKRSTPSSSNGALLDDLKTTASTRSERGSEHQKKKLRKESRKEKEKERESTAAKRTVGRPPKRAAALPAKRRREEKTTTQRTAVKKRARR